MAAVAVARAAARRGGAGPRGPRRARQARAKATGGQASAAPPIRVDLRSDTVTQPCEGMREAMMRAPVGDDVLGDDPTVQSLQRLAADMLGKEAGLFVPSGTMSNAIAIRAHTQPGDEIVTEATSHVYIYEGGGYAAIAGCSVALVPGDRGLMRPEDVQAAVRHTEGSLSHFPDATLVCVENTSNRGGGSFYTQASLDGICEVARSEGCAAHMDAARGMNAAVAAGTPPADMVRGFDTVSLCLSKGLGAPVGSVLLGSEAFIRRAHRFRKMLGGGMRQAGVLAAAGLYALENNVDRLALDHARARRLAEAVGDMPAFSVDLGAVQTNMVYIDVVDPEVDAHRVVQELAERGVAVLAISSTQIRAVTHLHVTDDGVEEALGAFAAAADAAKAVAA
mmetsp:Transcript_6263/g.22012  ORF Transcript_6263/g.22012 Transcript_6263/m.22012 type:complete len:394 (-) Transcript_6263:137-1318(-)